LFIQGSTGWKFDDYSDGYSTGNVAIALGKFTAVVQNVALESGYSGSGQTSGHPPICMLTQKRLPCFGEFE